MVIGLLCLLHNFNGRSCLVSEIHRRINYIQERFGIYNQLQGGVTISVPVDCEIISLDSYGRYFVDVCMSKKKLGSNTD